MNRVDAGYLVGIDVGGTFTDAVAYHPSTGTLLRAKVSTTADQSEGTMQVFDALGITPTEAQTIYHGFTVGLNAVLTRTGAKTGLLCTMGFRDLMDIGRVERPFGDALYDPHWMRPHQDRPIVARRHRRELIGRRAFDGTPHEPLDTQRLREELEFLAAEGVEAVAVCLLNAYANLDDEEQAIQAAREVLGPDVYIQSSKILPVAGEFERTFAVAIDAFTGPQIQRYLGRLRGRVAAAGHDRSIQLMQMNGGLRTLEATAAHFPALTLSSGPVAGALGASYYARNILGATDLVCVDIGGTSTDLALIENGVPAVTDNWEIEQAMPLGIPTVDIRSIGAGGGSLVRVDHVGTLLVGPDSAGARPGPVAYGQGGSVPTLTDGYLTLGYMAPELFLGGQMALDATSARAAYEGLGRNIGVTAEELARSVYEHVNRDIANAVRRMAFDTASDLGRFSLFAFGGAGPLHAVAVAQALGMSAAIVPYFAGGFSAVGMIVSKPKVEHLTATMRRLSEFDEASFSKATDELEQKCLDDLRAQSVNPTRITVERYAYVMYAGQSFDNRLPLVRWPLAADGLSELRERVDEHYARVYGYAAEDLEVIVTKLAVSATGEGAGLELPAIPAGTAEPEPDAVSLRKDAWFNGVLVKDVPFFNRSKLLAGNVLRGPAVIDDELGTTLLPPGARSAVDEFGTLRITWAEGGEQ